jgi:hypothetical protein
VKTPSKFRFTRHGAGAYDVTRIEDAFYLGAVWKNRFEEPFPSREAAARSLSVESLKLFPLQTKSKVWVSLVHEGRSISFITEILDSDVEALDPKTISHASCAITFEGRGIVAGHLWKVEES